MENEYLNEVDAIIKRAQRDILREVDDRLQHHWEQINRILTNGCPIFEQTYGDRYILMSDLRRTLITKMFTLSEAQGVIFEIMYKK